MLALFAKFANNANTPYWVGCHVLISLFETALSNVGFREKAFTFSILLVKNGG